jgi:hypothetical protein
MTKRFQTLQDMAPPKFPKSAYDFRGPELAPRTFYDQFTKIFSIFVVMNSQAKNE